MFWGHVDFRRRHLPHWEGTDATYFLTWSVARPQAALTAEERDIVASALRHFDNERYELAAWVVMDDHAHVLVRPIQRWSLSRILHSWKSYTAHKIVELGHRTAPVWQDESYDRIVRGKIEFDRARRYILENPQRKWPDLTHYQWMEPRSTT